MLVLQAPTSLASINLKVDPLRGVTAPREGEMPIFLTFLGLYSLMSVPIMKLVFLTSLLVLAAMIIF